MSAAWGMFSFTVRYPIAGSLRVLIILLCVSSAIAEHWQTDFSSAKLKAKEEGKNLLVCFTGSDWCGFCIDLKE